jgi:putative flippase GtrA
MKFISRSFLVFVLVGVLNTCVTYLIYILLLGFLRYQIAYSVTYVIGVYFSYYLNSTFVFRVKPSLRTAVKYPLVYVAQYLIGVALLTALVRHVGVPASVAAFVVIIVSVPLTFIFARIVLGASRV